MIKISKKIYTKLLTHPLLRLHTGQGVEEPGKVDFIAAAVEFFYEAFQAVEHGLAYRQGVAVRALEVKGLLQELKLFPAYALFKGVPFVHVMA